MTNSVFSSNAALYCNQKDTNPCSFSYSFRSMTSMPSWLYKILLKGSRCEVFRLSG